MAGEKTYSIPEVRERLAKTIKGRVDLYAADLLKLRHRELKKAEAGSCLICGFADMPGVCTCTLSKAEPSCTKCVNGCKCKLSKDELGDGKKVPQTAASDEKKAKGAVLPGDKKSKDVTPDDSGSGSDPKAGKKLGKAALPTASKKPMVKGDVPMASAPTKAGNASAPQSKGGSPKIAGPAAPKPPGSPMAKASSIPGQRLAKAGPRLGGKDPLSQGMTGGAMAAAGAAPQAATAPVPKLNPEQQASRQSQFADFTPKGAFAPAGAGAAGEMKAPPAGVGHLKAPAGALKGPQGTAAAPSGGLLQRFTDALHGKKAGAAPAMKNEFAKSLGDCPLCACAEHMGECPKT